MKDGHHHAVHMYLFPQSFAQNRPHEWPLGVPLCFQQKNSGSGSSMSDERVDYVVVDQQKTLALKSTREAWTDGRQSTESETPTKNVK